MNTPVVKWAEASLVVSVLTVARVVEPRGLRQVVVWIEI